jgi:glycosyltransferase involved in cell wall biosynthesis
MSLSDFRMLCGQKCPPAIAYFHENQLTYPVAPGEVRDLHFGFTDITTALAADRVLFNSETHLNDFFDSLPGLLSKMPDFRPSWVADQIREKSGVCRPGCWFTASDDSLWQEKQKPPLIIWNHRWEFDKQPEIFFAALNQAAALGLDFELAVLGFSYEKAPQVFQDACRQLGSRIKHFGYVSSREKYYQWLGRGSVAISTAIQENFGIAMVEAARFGCLPLVPDRLAYPEIIPKDLHHICLYTDFDQLVAKLCNVLANPAGYDSCRRQLALYMGQHAWQRRISAFDQEIKLAAG